MPRKGQKAAVLGWMRGFLLPLAWDSSGHIQDGGADLWEEAGTAWAQKMAGEIQKSILGRTGCSTL